jgi:hypothetical protein
MIRRRFLHLLVLLAVLLVVSSAATSCSDPLPPDYGLDASRVLAVRADPPDLVPGGSVKLDALVFVPGPTDSVTYEWSWCAAVDSNLDCAESASALEAQLEGGTKINYSLGSGPTAKFAYPIDPAILTALCTRVQTEAGADDAGTDASDAGDADADADAGDAGSDAGVKLDCNNGTDVTVSVLLKVTVNGKVMRAAKQITIYASQPEFTNTNPTITGIEAFGHAIVPPADGGDRSDDGIADAAGIPDNGASTRGDDGGVQLLLRVPTTASDSYTQGRGNNGGGNNGGGGNNNNSSTTTANETPTDVADSSVNDSGGRDADEPHDSGDDSDGESDAAAGAGAKDAGAKDAGEKDGGDHDAAAHDDDAGDDDAGSSDSDGGGGGGDNDAGGGGGLNNNGSSGTTSTDAGTTTTTTNNNGNNDIHESLTATWYVQAGLLDSASTTLAASNGTEARDFTRLVLNRWVPPGPGTYTIIVVIRDNRNGVGWFVQPIKVR